MFVVETQGISEKKRVVCGGQVLRIKSDKTPRSSRVGFREESPGEDEIWSSSSVGRDFSTDWRYTGDDQKVLSKLHFRG